MRVDLKQEIKAIDGKSVALFSASKVTVLGDLLISVLLTATSKVVQDKLNCWELAVRLQEAGEEIELSVEDVVLIKQLIGNAYGPSVVGRVWEMLT